MNLVSCDGCGVVLDADKLKFPEDVYEEGGSVDLSKAAWNGDRFVAFVACPVCCEWIFRDG